MMHPLQENLAEYSDAVLEQKLLKLNHMYFVTDNPDVRHQMILLMDGYKLELEARRTAAKLKQQQENGDNSLDDLINVS